MSVQSTPTTDVGGQTDARRERSGQRMGERLPETSEEIAQFLIDKIVDLVTGLLGSEPRVVSDEHDWTHCNWDDWLLTISLRRTGGTMESAVVMKKNEGVIMFPKMYELVREIVDGVMGSARRGQ